ncbi:phosphoethanolamine transferase [uncultured Selenomonas sp.]|uniref:phosphoethanolamine transferase n=1 Tax=uncultured Selenomonas sp. TaxID=159275 RepID=UPI0025875FB0|nr:phosphoethanolamine transferase [uncultured Selenomonas sp.]
MRQGRWCAVSGRLLRSWRWSGPLLLVLCLTNAPSLLQRDWFEGASLAFLPRAGLLAEEAVRVAGLSLLVTLVCGFLPRGGRCLVGAASALLALVDAFTLRQYHSVLDAGLLEVIAATNPAEAVEYVTSQARAMAPFLACAVLAVVLARWRGALLRVFQRALPQKAARAVASPGALRGGQAAAACKFQEQMVAAHAGRCAVVGSRRRGRIWPRCLAGALLAFFAASVCHAWQDPEQRVADVPRALSLFRLAANVSQAQEEIGSTAYVDYTLASQPVALTAASPEIPYVVFLLGESTSRHHMSLYGYGLPTTPRLEARDARGELAVFRAVTSPHAGTLAVVRTLFSFYDNASPGMWYEYGNVFDILRQAGVRTAWLSNQEASGFYGSIGRTLGGRCDVMQFTSHMSHSFVLSERYDEELMPLLDGVLAEQPEEGVPQFLMLHLMGAHEEFGRRYPAPYAQFTEEDERGRGVAASEEERAVRASYDNAVLYDDAVVDAVIRRFEGRDAVVIFLSDHGEEVYDVRSLAGHGDESSPWQRDIPCVFWMSETFRAQHPAAAARIRRATGRAWQSDEMIHTLLDLMQIRVPSYDAQKSLLWEEPDADEGSTA